jgi:hypothetical protein
MIQAISLAVAQLSICRLHWQAATNTAKRAQ